MPITEDRTSSHPTENDISDFLAGLLKAGHLRRVEDHIAECDECLAAAVSAYESASKFQRGIWSWGKPGNVMKKMNFYLILAIVSFALSFTMPRYFIQFLIATLVLGIKWAVDSKSTKTLIMVYEAWKSGQEKEVSRIFENMGQRGRIKF